MKENYLKQLKLIFTLLVVMACTQTATAAPSVYKLFRDCIEDMGDKGREPDVLIETCTKVIDSQPRNKKRLADAYMMRGIGCKLKGELDKALGDYTRSIELDPKSYDTYLNRANAWRKKGEYERAMNDLNEALSIYSKSAFAYYARSSLWIKMGDLEMAVKDGIHASKLSSSPRYLNMSCWARAIAGIGLDDALFACTKAIKRSRNMASYYNSCSLVNLRLNKFEDANEALKIAPDKTGTLFVRGIAKLRLGHKEEGEADLAAAKELVPRPSGRLRSFNFCSCKVVVNGTSLYHYCARLLFKSLM